MRILAVGGGSGGHVTPVVAVIRELKKHESSAEVRFWCDRKFASQATALMTNAGLGVSVSAIFSGKLRRYHGLGAAAWLDIPTLLQNLGDVFLLVAGVVQSFFKLVGWRPDVIFTKGGFVCLPVGIAAKLLGIPLVIHDSDAHPGLTNRILSRWARRIATGAPLEYYDYPKEKTEYIGIPVSEDFHKFSEAEKRQAREELRLPDVKKPLVVVTGGGLGAKRLNDAIITISDTIVERASVVHIAGTARYDELKDRAPQRPDYELLAFVNKDMAKVLGAADIVVTRAGATTMLELAALGMATIVVPNAQLTGGHQLKNAQVYQDAKAVIVLDEKQLAKDPRILQQEIMALLDTPAERERLGAAIHQFAKPKAAARMATIIMGEVKVHKR